MGDGRMTRPDHPARVAWPGAAGGTFQRDVRDSREPTKGVWRMATKAKAGKAIDDATKDALAALAIGQAEILEEAADLRGLLRSDSGLDPRSFALVKIAALVAVDAPPASYVWQVEAALEAGVTPGDIVGVLTAVAPQVGLPRVLAAAPEIMVALDLELPSGMDI
jgi:4-carboxymuconolactone decarboxylase